MDTTLPYSEPDACGWPRQEKVIVIPILLKKGSEALFVVDMEFFIRHMYMSSSSIDSSWINKQE